MSVILVALASLGRLPSEETGTEPQRSSVARLRSTRLRAQAAWISRSRRRARSSPCFGSRRVGLCEALPAAGE